MKYKKQTKPIRKTRRSVVSFREVLALTAVVAGIYGVFIYVGLAQ